MCRALLEGAVSGIVRTVENIDRYIRSTLFSTQSSYPIVHSNAKRALDYLQENEFLHWNHETKCFSATSLGAATVFSGFTPQDALIIFKELEKSRRNFVLDSELHLLYHVIPLSQLLEPNWQIFLQRYMSLSPPDRRVADALDISERHLIRWGHSGFHKAKPDEQRLLDNHKRFYSTLVLSLLLHETPLHEVTQRYQVSRGQLQALQTASAAYSGFIRVWHHWYSC